MFEHLAATLLQQSHLCPVPLEAQPVFWNFDHALHLYPLPDVLVLADRAPCASFGFPSMPADQAGQSCVCLNPVRPPSCACCCHPHRFFLPGEGMISSHCCILTRMLMLLSLYKRRCNGAQHWHEGGGCMLVQGSFMTGAFAAYAPSSRQVEPCDVPASDL